MIHVTWGIVIASGKAEQISPEVDTPFLNLGSKPVLSYSLAAYEQCPDISGVVVVAAKERLDSVLGMTQMFGFAKAQKIVGGSSQRQSCVLNGLKALDEDVTIVSIHDASRPCITPDMISESVKAAKRYGSGVTAVEITDAVKEIKKGLTVAKAIDAGTLWMVQTPQTFKRAELQKGYEMAARKKKALADDSEAFELAGEEVHLITAPITNLRIRTPSDFNVAMTLLKL